MIKGKYGNQMKLNKLNKSKGSLGRENTQID